MTKASSASLFIKATEAHFSQIFTLYRDPQGVAEAAKYMAQFDQDPKLAQTLLQIDALKKASKTLEG